MDSPLAVGYSSIYGWIGVDPRAGRQPEYRVKEQAVKRHDFKDGKVIFRKGDPSDAAYLITHGQVEIVQERRDGETESVAVLRRGEYFGEMGAIEEKPRSASAIARGPVACMSVSQEEFMDMLLNRPQESIDLLKVLFERLRKANEKLARIEGPHGH
jgi:CRP-like cAMP-binding protein